MSTAENQKAESTADADRFQSLIETLDESGVQATIELLAKHSRAKRNFPSSLKPS